MRKEIDFGQGGTLVFEDCGPNQFVISMLADYQANAPPVVDLLTGRAIKYSICLTGFHMVDVLKEAVTEWYKENEENKLPPPKKAAVMPDTEDRLRALEKKVAELEKRPIGNLVMAFPPAIGVLGDYPTMTVDGPMTDEMLADYKTNLTKSLHWYSVTFGDGDQVINAVRISANRPECRDLDDGTHRCIRQAASLRLAVKVSEFERQFGGCKKSTAK